MIRTIFGYPIMQVPLEQDLEKLIDFVNEVKKTNPEGGKRYESAGGWFSDPIENTIRENFAKYTLQDLHEYENEEFNNLKVTLQQQIEIYHLEFFKNTKFNHNVKPLLSDMWLNINSKHNWNDWHIHPEGIFSGTFYIQHDSHKNGDIVFKNPLESKLEYIKIAHKLHRGAVKKYDDLLSNEIYITPEPNMLLLFPAWLRHRVSENLIDKHRISLSFDTIIL